MIKVVTTKRDLKQFIRFPNTLYEEDPHYVPPLFFIVYKELKKVVLKDKTYTALLVVNNQQIVGRMLYTIDKSKHQDRDVGYFSFYDMIHDIKVSQALFDYMTRDMRDKNITHIEGTFAPYDPDTRRGILVKGFDDAPVIFTSYNKPYYQVHLETLGFNKVLDTVSLKADVTPETKKRVSTISRFFQRNHNVRMDYLDFNQLQRDMEDVQTVLSQADTEIIYQDTPDMAMIERAARQLKLFINPKMILIARENDTNRPVAFCLILPDYHQVFKKMKGKLKIITFLKERKHITRARGMMQYVVPEYQNSGLLGMMFDTIYNVFQEAGITDFEAGTIIEDNHKSIDAFQKFGGEIKKVYRIYGKDLD
ncbi:MAG: GNAT family N-acetyltransferase [Candidatus Izimaplasma sp.]|nr:GNAT family N-acetyltransferase [Candidatus Izimaplasma bacterium]